MSKDARRELDKLIATLERHFEIASSLQTDAEESMQLLEAEDALRNAFFTYDDVLFTTTGAELPIDILDDEDDEDDDTEEEDDAEDEDEDFDDSNDADYDDEDDIEDFDWDSED